MDFNLLKSLSKFININILLSHLFHIEVQTIQEHTYKHLVRYMYLNSDIHQYIELYEEFHYKFIVATYITEKKLIGSEPWSIHH